MGVDQSGKDNSSLPLNDLGLTLPILSQLDARRNGLDALAFNQKIDEDILPLMRKGKFDVLEQ